MYLWGIRTAYGRTSYPESGYSDSNQPSVSDFRSHQEFSRYEDDSFEWMQKYFLESSVKQLKKPQ